MADRGYGLQLIISMQIKGFGGYFFGCYPSFFAVILVFSSFRRSDFDFWFFSRFFCGVILFHGFWFLGIWGFCGSLVLRCVVYLTCVMCAMLCLCAVAGPWGGRLENYPPTFWFFPAGDPNVFLEFR